MKDEGHRNSIYMVVACRFEVSSSCVSTAWTFLLGEFLVDHHYSLDGTAVFLLDASSFASTLELFIVASPQCVVGALFLCPPEANNPIGAPQLCFRFREQLHNRNTKVDCVSDIQLLHQGQMNCTAARFAKKW